MKISPSNEKLTENDSKHIIGNTTEPKIIQKSFEKEKNRKKQKKQARKELIHDHHLQLRGTTTLLNPEIKTPTMHTTIHIIKLIQ